MHERLVSSPLTIQSRKIYLPLGRFFVRSSGRRSIRTRPPRRTPGSNIHPLSNSVNEAFGLISVKTSASVPGCKGACLVRLRLPRTCSASELASNPGLEKVIAAVGVVAVSISADIAWKWALLRSVAQDMAISESASVAGATTCRSARFLLDFALRSRLVLRDEAVGRTGAMGRSLNSGSSYASKN